MRNNLPLSQRLELRNRRLTFGHRTILGPFLIEIPAKGRNGASPHCAHEFGRQAPVRRGYQEQTARKEHKRNKSRRPTRLSGFIDFQSLWLSLCS